MAAGSEQVVRCAECGTSSADDLRGRQGWTLVRRSALLVVDVCPGCLPRPPADFVTSPRVADTTRITGARVGKASPRSPRRSESVWRLTLAADLFGDQDR